MTSRLPFLALMAAATLSLGAGLGPAGVLDAAHAEQRLGFQDQSRSDQGEARREMRAGNQLSLREIERRVMPRMRGHEYLGPSYDSTARAYRLKFIKDGRVTYVDVDARSGRIINRSN